MKTPKQKIIGAAELVAAGFFIGLGLILAGVVAMQVDALVAPLGWW